MKLVIAFISICIHLAALGDYISNARNGKETTEYGYANVYNGYGLIGQSIFFQEYVEDLSDYDFDNTICSARVTGFWLFYENSNYTGNVTPLYGVNSAANFPENVCNTISSLKFAGNQGSLDEDSFTLYDLENFQGEEFYGTESITNLTSVSFINKASSLIITGTSGFTFYNATGATGGYKCVQFNSSATGVVGSNTVTLHFGFNSTLGELNDKIGSVVKGCIP